MGFKAFHSAKATIDGIETAHMIRKGQLSDENLPAVYGFSWITVPADKCGFALYEYLRQILVHFVELRITNGILEGINSKIQLAKRRVRGYRNINNFINMIYFLCEKL